MGVGLHYLRMMILGVLPALLFCCAANEDLIQESWHDRYIEGNCTMCPDCCITSNRLAALEDGSVCFEDNHEKLSHGWTSLDLMKWCKHGGISSGGEID